MITEDELKKRFTHHPPEGTQATRYEIIRAKALDLGRAILEHTPSSREQSLALTVLDETVMWANAAIARNE